MTALRLRLSDQPALPLPCADVGAGDAVDRQVAAVELRAEVRDGGRPQLGDDEVQPLDDEPGVDVGDDLAGGRVVLGPRVWTFQRTASGV
jgi:hypothetical protein